MSQGFSDEGGDLRQCLRERNAAEKLNRELLAALETASAAIWEFHRYMYGGEMRGSYNGDSERKGLWAAGNLARDVIARAAGPK